MLSKIEMVKRALETQYIGMCSIIEQKEVIKPNRTTGFEDVVVLENQPCKLSFSTIRNADMDDVNSTASGVVKLFISPIVEIKPNSKIIVTQNNIIGEYEKSGVPAIYQTHQEIILKPFEKWS